MNSSFDKNVCDFNIFGGEIDWTARDIIAFTNIYFIYDSVNLIYLGLWLCRVYMIG